MDTGTEFFGEPKMHGYAARPQRLHAPAGEDALEWVLN